MTIAIPPAGKGQANFVRYDPKTGAVLSHGYMNTEMIDLLRKNGDNILITDRPASRDHHAVRNGTLVDIAPLPPPAPAAAEVRSAISGELVRTDHYVVADIAEDMTDGQKQQWRDYRKRLKDVFKMSDVQQMLAALPGKAPDDVDPFQRLRVATGSK